MSNPPHPTQFSASFLRRGWEHSLAPLYQSLFLGHILMVRSYPGRYLSFPAPGPAAESVLPTSSQATQMGKQRSRALWKCSLSLAAAGHPQAASITHCPLREELHASSCASQQTMKIIHTSPRLLSQNLSETFFLINNIVLALWY